MRAADLLVRGIRAVVARAGLTGPLDDLPRPPPEGRDDMSLPWLACRGVPRPVVVGDDPTVPGSHLGVSELRGRLATSCRHRTGFDCGLCRDADMVAEAVSVLGRVRVVPAA